MADFMNEFWNWYISIPTILGLIWCVYLAWSNSRGASPDKSDETMGHVWDEDLEEYNNPLPKWWLNLFYITAVFGFIYLLLYPGLGSFKGLLNWSEIGRYEKEVAEAEIKYGALFDQYHSQGLEELSKNLEAMGSAKRLFANNCAICHGSDARGTTGFPNLVDNDWLYGGDGETIKATITHGRNGVMPAWGAPLGAQGVIATAEYIKSLSGQSEQPALVKQGKEKYQQFCFACHGGDATGNPQLGAPNLTDNIWLYGGSIEAIQKSIAEGRNGMMPAQKETLSESKIHLLTAYLLSLKSP